MENTQTITDRCIYESDPVLKAAAGSFGITYLFPWQRLVIANILDASKTEDSPCNARQIVIFPTGSGKSLCFLVPSLFLPGPTLVIYPLLALMSDQQRRISEAGLGCVVFRGGQSETERDALFRKISSGTRLILANPEVLRSPGLLRKLASCGISHAAVDEAHCVSEWGETFRPAYLELGRMLRSIGVRVITAFTATASAPVLERISSSLFGGEAHVIRSEADRPNIAYSVIRTCSKEKDVLRLALSEQKPMVIFCGTRLHAEDLAREINTCAGRQAAEFYHAGLEKSEKDLIEKRFYGSSSGILCATCAYGMGVDKKDIHTIIHADVPETVESYVQESGRAGRNGLPARAVLLWSPEDSIRTSSFAEGSRGRVMKDFAESGKCRRQVLLDALGAEKAVCSGCDICDSRRNGSTDYAQTAFRFIRRAHRLYTKAGLQEQLLMVLNRQSRTDCKRRIWNYADIAELLSQMEKAGAVRTCSWPWKDRIEAVLPADPILRAFFQQEPEPTRFFRRHQQRQELFHQQERLPQEQELQRAQHDGAWASGASSCNSLRRLQNPCRGIRPRRSQ